MKLTLAIAALAAPPLAAQQADGNVISGAGTFNVLEFAVEGNSVLQPLDIEKAVYRFLGENKTFDDIEKARTALEKAYQDVGYLTVLVDVPEQQVHGGVVTLRVIEGKVERLRVTGSRYYSPGETKSRASEIAAGEVPYFPEVQKQLAQLNRNDDRRVTPVLRPGTTPGKVEVELKVDDKLPLHGDVELNNRMSANTEPLRLSGTLRYDNLWQKDHSVSLSYQTSPQETSQVKVWSGTYVIPGVFGDNTLAIYGVHSDSSVAAVGALSVLGNTSIAGLRYIMPLPQAETLAHSLTLGLDYKEFRDTVNLNTGISSETPVRYMPASLQYSLTQRNASGTWQIDVGANAGVRGLGPTNETEFANKRFNASSSYLVLKTGVSRQQLLGGRFSLFTKLDGQTASGPLISNEQYVAAGADTVRIYREAEVLGDVGARAALELRYALTATAESLVTDGYVLAYAEGASTRIFDPLPAQQQRFNLASAGLGLRMKISRHLRIWADVGQALKQTQFTPKNTVRGLFRVGYEF